MEVELDPSLLTAHPREDLVLLSLCAFGLTGRHRIVRGDREPWNQWASALPANLREEVLLAWEEGDRRASAGTASERVLVVPSGPDRYDHVPIRLAPREALGLLGRPLRVFLENGRNDRGFLLAFADASTRSALLEAERSGWVVFETAGGITELSVRLGDTTTARMESREAFRTMYLCDSDAREPGKPSDIALKVEKGLNDLGLLYQRPSSHFGTVLVRRAAENYAPPNEVLAWARNGFDQAWEIWRKLATPQGRTELTDHPGAANTPERHLLAAIALKELAKAEEDDKAAGREEAARAWRDVRGHLDMKEGRVRRGKPPDPDVERTAASIWSRLDPFQQAALMDGFGRKLSESFYSGRSGLHDETGEIVGLLAMIMERV